MTLSVKNLKKEKKMDPLSAFGIGSGLSAAAGVFQGAMNYKMQKKNLAWQKYVQRNQMQMRANDMQLAGLSKTLAAGSPGPVVSTQAPQMQGLPESVNNAFDVLTQGAVYEKTKMDTKASAMMATKLGAEASLASQKARLQKHDADLMQGKPFLYTHPSMVGSITRDITNAGKPAVKYIKNKVQNLKDSYMENVGLPFERKVRDAKNYFFGKTKKTGGK